jgi:Holliday junction resolvasome RuvABC endonuclease subunit
MIRTTPITPTCFTVLTNDPSITAWGWAVMDAKGRVIETGCIKTEPHHKKLKTRVGDDTVRRINEINMTLLGAIKRHSVCYLLGELPHGSQSAVAAKMLGAATAQLQTIADTLGLGLEWYSEGDSKSCALGKKNAEKNEMVTAIDKLYQVPWTGIEYRDQAVADAVAIFNVASKESPTLRLFKNQ